MKTIAKILTIAFWVLLPLLFIGTVFVMIPKFLVIYQEMYEGAALPRLTQCIVGIPRLIWLVVACFLSVLNVISISKPVKSDLLCLSILLMFLISGTVVVGLFLPLVEDIKQLPLSAAVLAL